MNARHHSAGVLALLTCLAGAGCQCGVFTGEAKPRTVNVTAQRAVDAGVDCGASPLPAAVVDLAALFTEAGIDPSQGCVQALSFGLVEDLQLTPGAGCDQPRGTGTLSALVLGLTCSDGTRRALTVDCPDHAIDFADQPKTYQAVNRCLDAAETQLVEPVRQAINTCRPTRLEATFSGSCAADVCATVNVQVGFRLNSATVQLGGTCP